MEAVKDHWRTIGCTKGVLLHASQAGRAVYEKVGFASGNLLLAELGKSQEADLKSTLSSGVYIEAAGEECDENVVRHWRQMWLEAGMDSDNLRSDLPEITVSFIRDARKTLQYQTFVARNPRGEVVGSASSQLWSGPIPLVLDEAIFKLGTVWAVYVHPQYRRQGVAQSLMEHCMNYWRRIGCQKGILIYASETGRRVYERLGFQPANGMVIDLCAEGASLKAVEQKPSTSELEQQDHCASETTADTPRKSGSVTPERVSICHGETIQAREEELQEKAMVESLRTAGVVGDERWLQLLVHALPHQLRAAFGAGGESEQMLMQQVVAVQKKHGIYIDPTDNWFTQNVKRFGGGFDMQKLTAAPGELAAKFDKLSSKYDHWSSGNCSRVQEWLGATARNHQGELGGSKISVLDVACGIGLPAHQLRLCGYKGFIAGTDISRGMVDQSRKRRAYDALRVLDANEGLHCFSANSSDLVVCLGAMELLKPEVVLPEFARVLKSGGQLWVSFQLEDPSLSHKRHPTAHQNVFGMTNEQITAALEAAGFT